MRCPLAQAARGDDRCVMGKGDKGARLMVVTKYPMDRKQTKALLANAGFDDPFYQTAALKCKTYGEIDGGNDEIKQCRHYLDQEISVLRPEWILTLGNEALFAVTGHSGIMKHRGHIYPRKDNPDIRV
ncbi:MAG: uracil-DNA glycosylase family protein, partial [Gloeomargaritales cyanobacterium]